jgi:hypothetical protein
VVYTLKRIIIIIDLTPTCQALLTHIESIVKEEPMDEKDLKIWAYLLTNAAEYLYMIGSYKAAEEMGRKVVDGRGKVLGREHLDTLTSMNNLAIVLNSQGKYEEADPEFGMIQRATERK